MEKYVSIDIDKKDCKGIYLFCDTDNLKASTDNRYQITSTKQADKVILGNRFKLQLRTKIDNKTAKKTYTFDINKKTFLKALEYVASQREVIREKFKADGTVREVKEIVKVEVKGLTFKQVMEQYLKDKEISARKSTMVNYSTVLNHHCLELHDKEFSKITIKDIQEIIHRLLSENKAPATVVLFARTLKAFFNKHKELSSINFDDLALPEVDNKVEYKLSLEDTKKILKVMREYSKIDLGDGEVFYQYEEIKNIFAFSLTGRRISEILSLKFSDFDLENKSYSIISTNTKGKKKLDFVLDDYLIQAIHSQAKIRKIDLYSVNETKLFSYTKETPRVHFQNLLKALGLPKLRLHDIRHMLATTLVQNGVAIQDISRMLGHSTIAITEQRYAKTSKEQANRATNAFNSLMED